MQIFFLKVASLLGGLAVVLGAFGGHYLKRVLSSDALFIFETGVRYQMYHVFALFISAWAIGQFSNSLFSYSAWAFVLGMILFSGSLYILSLYKVPTIGMVTPIGGICLVIGWMLLFLGFYKGNIS